MALKPLAESGLRCFFAEVKKFHLRPVKKMSFQFDPFHHNAKSIRDIIYHLSARRVRRTSETCVVKTDVVCDRSEPTINIDLHNGMNVLFKCANLNPLEIAREFNSIIEKYDLKKEEFTVKVTKTLVLPVRRNRRRKFC